MKDSSFRKLKYFNHMQNDEVAKQVVRSLLFYSSDDDDFLDQDSIERLACVIHEIAMEGDIANMDLLINLCNIIEFEKDPLSFSAFSKVFLERYKDEIIKYDYKCFSLIKADIENWARNNIAETTTMTSSSASSYETHYSLTSSNINATNNYEEEVYFAGLVVVKAHGINSCCTIS